MGHVMSIGLDLMGTARSLRLDESFREEMRHLETMVATLNDRERQHVHALKLWADGYVFMDSLKKMLPFGTHVKILASEIVSGVFHSGQIACKIAMRYRYIKTSSLECFSYIDILYASQDCNR